MKVELDDAVYAAVAAVAALTVVAAVAAAAVAAAVVAAVAVAAAAVAATAVAAIVQDMMKFCTEASIMRDGKKKHGAVMTIFCHLEGF